MNAVLHEFMSPGTQGGHWRKASLPRQSLLFCKNRLSVRKDPDIGIQDENVFWIFLLYAAGTGSRWGYESM
jgi:hypothetical protein